ncbi:MAG: DUF5627 domain-containing protein [Prevotella sp.]|nr:DUF5627 domain-containing protein [Prevotella sp.]
MKKIFLLALSGLLTLGFTSCKNGDSTFDDFEGGVSVYFAYQNPVRTLVMGEDDYDTSLDNAHKCKIYATMGGAYSGRDIKLQIAVDNSLVDNVYFDVPSPYLVKPMPETYYKLGSNTIAIDGSMRGAVDVEFTDAFFNDPKSVENTYVIPLVIQSQTGADRVLTGTPLEAGTTPKRTDYTKWGEAPMDYVLYLVKYMCKYDANYQRRGEDQITVGGKTTTVVRGGQGVEKDETLYGITTRSLNSINYPVSVLVGTETKTCSLIVTFDANDNAVITSGTEGVKASGTGVYEEKAEKKSWNNKDRDRMTLDYTIDFGDGVTVKTKDILVWRDRGVKVEEFASKYGNE